MSISKRSLPLAVQTPNLDSKHRNCKQNNYTTTAMRFVPQATVRLCIHTRI